ncbi:MAG: RNA polymerase sigma factor [Acidobacteriota bacterium]
MDDLERSLVMAAADGDRSAFGRLAERHWARLTRLARSVTGPADCEDAVQEGLLAAWQGLSGLADPNRFGAWVTRIVFRRCLRRLRQVGAVPLELVAEPATDTDPDSSLLVWQLLAMLAPRQRAVMHLTVVEGMSDSEIAQRLGLRAASVRAHRRRARECIEAALRGGRR